MKVLAAPDAQAFVREHGGPLYVWIDRTPCCGGAMTVLQTAWDSPEGEHDFHEFVGEGFRLYLDSGRFEPPDELHLGSGVGAASASMPFGTDARTSTSRSVGRLPV